MARKGKIEIGASVTVGAKEDGSLSKIEKRVEKLSNEEIEINIKDATKHLKELEKMEKMLGKNMAGSIEAQKKRFTDLIEQCKQEQKLRAENLKQVEQEVKAAKELQKIAEKTAKTQKQKNNGPTKREQELAAITKGVKGIRGVVNTFDDSKIQKTEEKVRKLIGALDEYQTKLDAMRRLRKGNERTMYDTAKSEIADLKRALGAVQAIEDQTPNIKPKIEKKEKEVEQEKSKKTTTQQPVVGAGDSAKSIQEQTMKIEQQASSMKKLGNAAEQTGKQISTVLNKAVQKYNEIMSSIDADSVIGGAGGVTIENIGGLKGMLQKTKRIYDMYYESGTTFSDQRNGTQQEKALWKSETAALRGFLTSYSKYVDDSAEAIYAKIQGKKKEFAKYKLPEYSASESQDDEKYLAFKKEELSIYEKQLVVATELFELQRKYNGAKSYTPNWNKELDKDDDEVRALDFTESAVDNYREMAKLAKTSLDRVVEEIETKKARLTKQTAQAQEQEAASTARNNNLEHYNQLVQECIQLTGELSDAVAKHARVQREMANILQSGNIIPQELKDAREQIEEVISGYFKKDFFEPTLSTDGILMWLQSAEAAAISIDRLVDSVEFKYKQMLAAQSELDNTSKINSETTAIQTNTQAVEENIKAKKKQNKIKVRDLTREEYDAAQEKYQQENDGALESLEDTVEIIRQASEFGTSFSTQMETSCKRATTAVQRFFSAIDPNKYPAIASWKDPMLESVRNGDSDRNGYFNDKDMYNGMYTGQYSWGVETIDEDRYYVFLNLLDVAKDKEKEFYAYLNEEYKKRDEGLEKQNELTRRLIQTYKKLDELHVNEPSWDKNNEVKSIKRRLEYYEQEKALLQDIQNLEEEFSTIPGRYVNTSDFNEVLRVHWSTLRLGDYGNGNLKDNARAIVFYQAELERAIKRLDKTTALSGQAQEQLKVEQQITAEKQKQNEQQAAANKEVTDTSKGSNALTDLQQFDAEKEAIFTEFGPHFQDNEQYLEKFKSIYQTIRENLANGLISYEDAYTNLAQETSNLWTQMQNDVAGASQNIKKLSLAQRAKMFDDASVQPLLDAYHIEKKNQNEIYDEFDNLGNMIATGVDTDSIEAQKSNIVSLVLKSAKREVETGLESFFEEIRSGRIYYDSDEIREVGKDTFAGLKNTLSSYNLLTPNRKNGLRADEYFTSLSDYAQGLIKNAFEREYNVGFNGSKSNIMQGIAAIIQRAPSKFANLSNDEQEDVRQRAAGIVDKVASNVKNLLQVESKVTGELENQNEKRKRGANAASDLKDAEDEKSVFPAEKVETEIDRIRKAIHSSEIGLDQIANTEGLQAAVATYVKSLDEIDDKKFKLISADINEVAEGVDRVTLKFQSLEDENVKLAQTWAMDDGELTLGRLRTTKTFVDSESNFDTELERTVANSKIDALESQLIGIDHVSQKVTDSLTSLRTAARNISSDSDIKTFAKNFQVAQNYIKEFKNEYKTLGSLANETQNAQAKMANAQETINAQISSSAKYIGVDGYDKVTQSIDNMTSALSKYNEAQKSISDGGLDAEAISKYEKQMADAFTEYNKAEKQLGAAMKEVRANASFDTFSKSMKDAETVIDTAKLKLDKFGDLDGVDKASGYIENMTAAWKKFNDADSTIEDKAQAVKDFTSANESFMKQVQYLNEVQKNTPKEEPVSSIQTYYEQYVSAIKDLNNVNQQLFAYQGKNESGVYNGLIEQLQQQKIRILAQLQDINSSVEEEVLNIYNPISMDGDKYKFDLSRYLDVNTADTIKEFFNNASVEAELGAESIQKFIDVAMQSQKIDAAFGEGVAKQYKSINDLHESTKEFADTNAEQIFKSIQARFAAKLTSGTDWTQEQENRLQSLIETYTEYATAIDKAVQKERKILSSVDGKNILQGDQLDPTKDMYDQMVDQAEKMRQATGATAVSIGDFDEVTGRLTFTLDGADGKARTFTMSMTKLGHVAVAQVKKIDKVKTGWDEFRGSLGGVGKQLLQYGLRMVEIYDIIRYLRQGFNEVLQIDTAMTELKKVTDETAVAYDNFAKSAYASSKKIGSTMKEFIQASADFARLGYSIDEASQLAEAANVYKNVGDGIDDVAQASESIISTMKAFNIEATDSMGIVDRFNEIGNNFAIDSVGIGEALQRSASALAEAGNSIDESIALVTAAMKIGCLYRNV